LPAASAFGISSLRWIEIEAAVLRVVMQLLANLKVKRPRGIEFI